MNEHIIAIGVTTGKPESNNKTIYYDLENKKFYLSRTANKGPEFNKLYLMILFGNLMIGFLNEIFHIEYSRIIAYVIGVISLVLSVLVIRRTYINLLAEPWEKQAFLMFAPENEIEHIMYRARKWIHLMICSVIGFAIGFAVCLVFYILSPQVIILVLGTCAWSLILLLFPQIKPEKRIEFFRRYKEGELL